MHDMPLERFHPQYRELHAELLARPFPVVSGHVMVAHRAILFTPDEAVGHRAAIAALAAQAGVAAAPEEQRFQLLRLGSSVDLRIERHTEFTAFTVFAPQAGAPFAESAIDLLSAHPGETQSPPESASERVLSSVWL